MLTCRRLIVYANSYLGSLNNRQAIRAHLSHSTIQSSGHSYALQDIRRQPISPDTIVHIECTTQVRKDDLAPSSIDLEGSQEQESEDSQYHVQVGDRFRTYAG
jgi:hypothetical protein